jgi:hypothetical protein
MFEKIWGWIKENWEQNRNLDELFLCHLVCFCISGIAVMFAVCSACKGYIGPALVTFFGAWWALEASKMFERWAYRHALGIRYIWNEPIQKKRGDNL